MMPIWSPGFYRVEDYAARVHDLAARTPTGRRCRSCSRGRTAGRFETSGAADSSSRTALPARALGDDQLGLGDLGVLNGAPTFSRSPNSARRPHEVRLELPPQWTRAMTSLDPAPDGAANHYRADDYDTLVDSPIVAGDLDVHEFDVDGSRHVLVDAGDVGRWDGARAARDLREIVARRARLWGSLPYKRYVFLNLFRQGGGGLEHLDSTLLTVNAARAMTPARLPSLALVRRARVLPRVQREAPAARWNWGRSTTRSHRTRGVSGSRKD